MSAPGTVLPWDSELFGLRIGRLDGGRPGAGSPGAGSPDGHRLADGRLEEETLAAAADWWRRERLDCVYFLAAADHPETVRRAEDAGFRLVDLRLTLDRPTRSQGSTVTPDAVRPARPEDIPALEAIARGSHRDSRFYADPGFPDGRCDDLYGAWIRNSCEGWADRVLVADPEGSAAAPRSALGYVTCHLRPGSADGEDGAPPRGEIGLVGVAEAARGRGLGPRLLEAARQWFEEAGTEVISVVTQGRNEGAQRLYQRSGFVTRSCRLWYHLWPR